MKANNSGKYSFIDTRDVESGRRQPSVIEFSDKRRYPERTNNHIHRGWFLTTAGLNMDRKRLQSRGNIKITRKKYL